MQRRIIEVILIHGQIVAERSGKSNFHEVKILQDYLPEK